ncbi:MAG: flagellar assembly protein FliH [Acidobacteriota bacterium]
MRPHRFPSLSQVAARAAAGADGGAALHAGHEEGFQQGLDKGYQEGFDAGQESGHAAGLSAGYEEGRQRGWQEGLQEAQARFEALAKPVDQALAELRRAQADYQAVMRKEVVELVAKVARQVIRCELTLQPTQLLALIDETLAAMPPAPDGVEIALNPEECQRIKELAPERVQQWTLIPDARLALGECRVKAGEREADAGCNQRLTACLDQVRAQLSDTLEAAPASEAVRPAAEMEGSTP